METIHKTVLLEEAIEALNLKDGMTVVDATLGGGGHSREILKRIGEQGRLVVFDRDAAAIERFVLLTKKQSNVFTVHADFSLLKEKLTELGIENVDAILADFGISSDQLDDAQRGMSFLRQGPLDMRMDRSGGVTAAVIVNTYDENELVRILREFGDEKYATNIARGIVKAREEKKIETTFELVAIVEKAVPAKYKHQRIHPATRTFQALRIEVNRELESIRKFLGEAVDVLNFEGRLVVITFHSGEDLLAKEFFRENARGCICPPQLPVCVCGQKPKLKIITKKPVLPGENEVKKNSRARSAKLRVAQKNSV